MTPRAASDHARRRIARLRLAAQLISSAPAGGAADAVRWMLAMQAQDEPGVRWSVGLRTAGATEADVAAACDAGEIVRSWPLRGTLHLVAAEDLPWMLGLTAERAIASAARRRDVLGITVADVERAREIAIAALPGRSALTRAALLTAIGEGGVSTAGQRGYHLLWHLAQTGTLVLGPTDGRRQLFARLDAWVPDPRRLERDEALGELAGRYFRSHGPAVVEDLARWSGLTLRDVRRGIAVCGPALTTIVIGGRAYVAAAEAAGVSDRPDGVRLLPGFDEYLLGYRDRSSVLAPEHSEAIVPGGNGMFKATIVADGEVVGTWGRRGGVREVVLEAEPFAPLPAGEVELLRAAADGYGRFLGRTTRTLVGGVLAERQERQRKERVDGHPKRR
jgi:hypothetical protein